MADYRLHLLAGAATAAALGLTASSARAQDAQEAVQLDEIIVTAQLREQRAIEVPFALSAYSGEQLEALGIQEFDALSALVPGFLVQNQSPNNPGFVIRGITSDSTGSTDEPRVSVFQDGVAISRSPGAYVELFDLDRVEVSKGPQSTLYGRGALIGAVNIVQNKARPGQFEAEGRVEVGDLDYRSVQGMVNLPLGEDGGLRLAGRIKTRDGFVENLAGGENFNSIETQAFRLSGVYAPSDAFRFDLIANYQEDQASGTPFKSIAYDPADAVTGVVYPGASRAPWDGAAFTPGGNFYGGRGLGVDREVWGVTGLARLDLSPSLTLNSTTAYRTFNAVEVFDPDGISLPLLTAVSDVDGEQWSQEFRLGFDNGGRVSGFVGAGYFREEGTSYQILQVDERVALAHLVARLSPATGSLLDGQPGVVGNNTLPLAAYSTIAANVLGSLGLPAPFIPGIVANLKPAHQEAQTVSGELQSFDLFADMTFQATDQLEFAVGLRYTRDEKTTGFSSAVLNGRSVLAIVQSAPGTIAALSAVNPALAAQYLTALATPGLATADAATRFPVMPQALPMAAILSQPTTNNGDVYYGDLEDDGLTWRLTARYALSDTANLYANYARGRRPAVLSASAPAAGAAVAAPSFKVVDAETVDSFEVGGKAVAMDGRLRFDGAVFHYAYENFQTTEWVGALPTVVNAGEASAYGFEGQVSYAATADFDLFATYGYNHARFGSGARDGNRFRLSPDHMASIGATWRVAAGPGAIEIQPTYSWQSKVFFDDDNDRADLQVGNFAPDLAVDEFQDAYGLLNLRVRYVPASGAWGVEAFGDNILDEKYIKDAGNTGDILGMPTFVAGRGATWGVGFTVRY